MIRVAALPTIAVLLAGCQTSPPVARMSLPEAEVLCTRQATVFARRPLPVRGENGVIQVGLLAELPDSFMVRDYYRGCVYANAGVRPDVMPDIPVYG